MGEDINLVFIGARAGNRHGNKGKRHRAGRDAADRAPGAAAGWVCCYMYIIIIIIKQYIGSVL